VKGWMSAKERTNRALTAAYLASCAPEHAYRWMEDTAPKTPADARRARFWKYEQKLQEYVLLRRRHPLIDLALARFARNSWIVRRGYRRGGAAVQLGAWANPAMGDPGHLLDLLPLSQTRLRVEEAVMLAQIGVNAWKLEAWRPDLEEAVPFLGGKRRYIGALATNIGLTRDVLELLITRTGLFASMSDVDWHTALRALGDNPASVSYTHLTLPTTERV